jgi:predicted MFS family arabinose efflux permease
MDRTNRSPSPPWVAFGAIITSAMAIGTVGPFVLSALAPFIIPELGLSRTQFGTFVTFYFLVGAVASPWLGSLVDRVGGWRMVVTLFAVSALSLAMMAAAPGYAVMVVAMAVGGIANGLTNPATNQVINRNVPPGRRGALVGVKQSGVQIGAAVSGFSLPAAALAFGWRPTTLGCAVLALAGVAACWLARPGGRAAPPATTDRVPGAAPRAVRWLTAYAVFMGAGIAAVTMYIVLYAHERLGFSETHAGWALAVLGAVAVVARIVWARRVEGRATVTGVLTLLAVTSVAGCLLLAVAPATHPVALWVAVVALGASAGAWNSVGMLAIIDGIDGAFTGRASGHVLAGFFAGYLVSPALFGALVDVTGSYELGWVLTAAVFAVALGPSVWRHRRGSARRAVPQSGIRAYP